MPRFYRWMVEANEVDVERKITDSLSDFESDEIKDLFSFSNYLSNQDKYLCLSLLVTHYLWMSLSQNNKTRCMTDAINIINRNKFFSDEAKMLLVQVIINSPDVPIENFKLTEISFFALMNDIDNFPFPFNLKCITSLLNAKLSDEKSLWANLLNYSFNHGLLENFQSVIFLKMSQTLYKCNKGLLNMGGDESLNIAPELITALAFAKYEINLSDIFSLLHASNMEGWVIEKSTFHVSIGLMLNFIKRMPDSTKKKNYLKSFKQVEAYLTKKTTVAMDDKKRHSLISSLYGCLLIKNLEKIQWFIPSTITLTICLPWI